MKFLPFDEARKFVHALGLKTGAEWSAYCKSEGKPDNIPRYPMRIYKNQWKGIGDWLGTGRIANQNRVFRSFKDARTFAQSLGFKEMREWVKYCTSSKKPIDIPSTPHVIYRKDWKGWGDFLGTGYIASYKRSYRSFEEARKFAQSLKLKSEKEWKSYCRSGRKPVDIPNAPASVYRKNWKGMGDWLGTGFISLSKRKYRPFKEAAQFVHSLGLKNRDDWIEFCQSGNKPADIPNKPNHVYEKDWTGWGDWLGTGYIANKNRIYLSFQEARKFAQSLGLKNREEWNEFCKKGEKPIDIPTSPWITYRNQWLSMPDWLGYEEKQWSVKRIKELLQSLIESKIIYTWDEAILYSLLLRKGLLSLGNNNRHNEFFRNLLSATKTVQGRKLVEEYVNSSSEIPPDL